MSSSESEEENIKYGTPLEPYEEDEVPTKKKAQREADQHALDAQGRRRFHGAFTGGFSAGFGNSVGTQEGWAPSAFKSSRFDKAKTSNQKPEDFMDEEDRSQFGIAPRQIQKQRDFSGQKRPHEPKRFHDGPIPGEPVLEQLVRTVHETAAVKMLRAMGWRPGQGTGERLTSRKKRLAIESQKVYGCYLPSELKKDSVVDNEEEESSSSDTEFDYGTLFAPDDYEPYILSRKNDHFGLGYSGLSRHSVLGNLVGEYGSESSTSTSHLVMKDKGKKVSIRGQAFGVGALEEDDEDIYAKEDMSHYDFVMGGQEPVQKTIPKQKTNNVLEGFVRSSKPIPPVACYPPPSIPRDYVPLAAGARRSRFEPTTSEPRDQGLGRHELSAEARGNLLGEVPIQKPEVTEEQEIPQTTKDPIINLLGRNVDFVTTKPNTEKSTTVNLDMKLDCKKSLDYIPINVSEGGDLKTFKPFAGNQPKQMRYERYLLDRDGASVLEGDGTTGGLSEWERNRELVEFEQAAKLYKPLTGVMGDRFTHATQPDEALNPLSAVAKSANNHGLATEEQIDAATKGLYGRLTRAEVPWRPEALVCKRFNIPDPYISVPEPKKNEKSRTAYSIFEYLESSVHNKDSFTKEQSKFSGSKSTLSEVLPKPRYDDAGNNIPETKQDGASAIPNKRITVAELFMRESEKVDEKSSKTEEVTEAIDRFDKMKLYKSIFLSDSEEEEEKAPDNGKNSDASYTDFADAPKNVERNTSPPRGIFANIDFDELNSWNRPSEIDNKIVKNDANKQNDTHNANKEIEKESEIDDNEIYGPKIPDNFRKQIEGPSKSYDEGISKNVGLTKPVFRSKNEREAEEINSSSSSDSWVEINKVKTKKQKKKKSKSKKHKSKHKKSKHKKKDK